MAGLLVAGFLAAAMSSAAAPAVHQTAVKPKAMALQFVPATMKTSPRIQKTCGMLMIVGDASLDPGILMGARKQNESVDRKPDDRSSCGDLMLVRPVKRQSPRQR